MSQLLLKVKKIAQNYMKGIFDDWQAKGITSVAS